LHGISDADGGEKMAKRRRKMMREKILILAGERKLF
jgi:hypothetical protein